LRAERLDLGDVAIGDGDDAAGDAVVFGVVVGAWRFVPRP
jgi:hypothetical protein